MNSGRPCGEAACADTLTQLRSMVTALENGDEPLFESQMNRLLSLREQDLLGNVVKITRSLHYAVRDIDADERVKRVASAEIPDACQRLDHVVKMTEEAAHKTLDLVDHSKKLTDRIAQTAASADAQGFGVARTVIGDSARQLRAHLTELAQIQEYQDLTGQIIKRVIRVVRDVESDLIVLLRHKGSPSQAAAVIAAPEAGLQGPAVPGLSVSHSQQDADALLAELGF